MMRILKCELGGLDKGFKASDFEMDIKPLLKLVLSTIFGQSSQALVEVMVENFDTAKDAGPKYIKDQYLKVEDESSQFYNKLLEGSAKGPLCINILKQFYNEKQGDFGCFGRILSGTISKG